MYHTVVITCGTSFNISDNAFSLSSLQINENLNLHSSKWSNEGEEGRLVSFWLDKCKQIFTDSYQSLNVSAEYSTIYALKQAGKLHIRPTIVLVVTDSIGGKMAEMLLTFLFEQTFQANVKVVYVTLDVSDEGNLNNQIGEYMSRLTDALSEGEPTSTCFVPLGGYKVMTSYGYIVGSLLKYPTVYVNEYTQNLIQIPWIPINVDQAFIEEHSSLLRKCWNDYIKLEDLSYTERQMIPSHPYIFEREDELVGLTPFGQFLLQQSEQKHTFGTQYYVSEQVLNLIKNKQDQSIFVAQQLKELVKKLKFHGYSDFELTHEKSFRTLDQSKIQYQLYKGSSNGNQTVFRLAYSYDQHEDRLYANYLWFDHDLYEREAASGKGLYAKDSEFFDVTDGMASKT